MATNKKYLKLVSLILMLNLYSMCALGQSVDGALLKVTIAVDGMMKSKSGATWMSWPNSVSAALSELPGVKKVDVDLETDQFTVAYDEQATSSDEMEVAIETLGYRPRVVQSRITPLLAASHAEPIPAPIAMALEQARKTNAKLFIDFYAKWCGACKVMEKTTLADPDVLNTLGRFHVLKVDVDEFPNATQYFKVFGMPTYIVLNSPGEEQYRHVGPLGAEKLIEDLSPLLRH